MTNREHYKEVIEKIVYEKGDHIAVDSDGNVVPCRTFNCYDCKFYKYNNCNGKRADGSTKNNIEPSVDWSKVPVDTKILVRDSENEEWQRRYFATYWNGKVYAFYDGLTSWTADEYKTDWEYAKLAKEEE